MEDIVEVFVKKTVENNTDLEYLSQATSSKIKNKWYYDVEFDRSQRKYDFAIFNKKTSITYVINVKSKFHFYNL